MNPPKPCVPFTPCWCELHPNNPNCAPNVPINNNGLTILIIIAIFIYLLINNVFKRIK